MLRTISMTEAIQVVLFFLFLLLSVIGWLIKRRVDDMDQALLKSNQRGEAAIDRVDNLENRITLVEADMRHLPDKDVTHSLEKAIGDLRTEVSVLSERIKPVAAIADRVQEAMLEKMR